MLSRLGRLTDPKMYNAPLDLENTPTNVALDMLSKMLIIRGTEELIADMVTAGDVKCPCHFAIGQEATAVGVAEHLRPTDRSFGAHRSHSHFLASGGSVEKLLAEVLGRATGASRGMGGSMHLYGADFGFAGSVPIVAGTVPLAVGAALAAKMDKRGDIGIAYFGDGACEEGIVHESMNLAAIMKLPVLFVVENNLYSSHLDINLRQPSDRVARFAESHGIPVQVIDGNDVVAVAKSTGKLVEHLRRGGGPGFIEAVTYRWLGHVGPDENLDVGLRRSAEEITAWKMRDPILRLEDAILSRGVEAALVEELKQKAQDTISSASIKAYDAPWPKASALLDYVYAQPKVNL